MNIENDFLISKSTKVPDVIIFKPSVNTDLRGSIYTSYHQKTHDSLLPDNLSFVHDKFSISKKNVLRGLHGDTKTWKLISCVHGKILQVIVDYRPKSKYFLHWDKFYLGSDNNNQLLIPPNFVNGFLVLSDEAVFHYKLGYEGKYFDVNDQIVVKWDDERLNIDWPIKNPILQNRDS